MRSEKSTINNRSIFNDLVSVKKEIKDVNHLQDKYNNFFKNNVVKDLEEKRSEKENKNL